jgi:hypothetical protein
MKQPLTRGHRIPVQLRLFWGALFLVACGGVRYDNSTKRSTACTDFSNTMCNKFADCGILAKAGRSDCVTSNMATCCFGGTCSGEITLAKPDYAAECINEMGKLECAALKSLMLPAACREPF